MLSQVTCPHCHGQFTITVDDFQENPESKYCFCIFCRKEFGVLEGKPWPPLGSGRGAVGHGMMM